MDFPHACCIIIIILIMYPWHMWGKLEFKVQQTDDTSVRLKPI